MRVGMAQIEIPWHSYKENQKKCRDCFKAAKEQEIDILVFPEMTLTGFDVHSQKLTEKEEEIKQFFDGLT